MEWRRCVLFKWKTSGLKHTCAYTAVVASMLCFGNFTNMHNGVSYVTKPNAADAIVQCCRCRSWTLISDCWSLLFLVWASGGALSRLELTTLLCCLFHPLMSGLLCLLVVGQGHKTRILSLIALGFTKMNIIVTVVQVIVGMFSDQKTGIIPAFSIFYLPGQDFQPPLPCTVVGRSLVVGGQRGSLVQIGCYASSSLAYHHQCE